MDGRMSLVILGFVVHSHLFLLRRQIFPSAQTLTFCLEWTQWLIHENLKDSIEFHVWAVHLLQQNAHKMDCCSKPTPLPKARAVSNFWGGHRGATGCVSAFSGCVSSISGRSSSCAWWGINLAMLQNTVRWVNLGKHLGKHWLLSAFIYSQPYHNIIQSNSRYPGFLYIITRLVTHENVYYSNPEPTRNLHVSMASCTWVRVHLSIPANTNQFSDLSERVDRRVRMPTAHLIADFLTQINLIQGTSKPMLKRGW